MEINDKIQRQIEIIKEKSLLLRPLVVIRCITYNQEQFIRDALDGFLMQKTSFPFVAIVHDDASTDNTKEIICEYAKKYPDIILPIFEEENQYSKHNGSVGRVINFACFTSGAKYIAFCEGDDYWTDPLKLQKQVNFLENNPEYGLIYTKVSYFCQKSKRILRIWGGSSETFDSLLKENVIPTLTVLLRTNIYKNYLKDIQPENHKDWRMGDYPIWLYFSLKSQIKFLQETTGVYRILSESASHSKSYEKQLLFSLGSNQIINFFNKYIGFETTISSIKIEELKLQLAIIKKNKELIDEQRKALQQLSKKKICKLLWLRIKFLCLFPKLTTNLLKIKRFL